jgi:hypothetical protein
MGIYFYLCWNSCRIKSFRNIHAIEKKWLVLIRKKKLVSAQARSQSGLQYFVIIFEARSLCSRRAVFLCLAVCVWKSVFVFATSVDTLPYISTHTSLSPPAPRHQDQDILYYICLPTWGLSANALPWPGGSARSASSLTTSLESPGSRSTEFRGTFNTSHLH